MRRLRGVSRSGWVVVGLVVGAIVVPAVAVAATITVVQVKGGGNTAFVSPANQLRATEMDPSYNFHRSAGAGNACVNLGVISAGRGAVVKQVVFDAQYVDGSVATHYASLLTGDTCGGRTVVSNIDFDRPGVTSVPLGPGVTLPPNTPLSIKAVNGGGSVDVYGYTVSAAAAPASAGVQRHMGSTAEPRPADGPH